MRQNFMDLPLRNGVGIMVINKEKKVFVGKRIDNQEAWQMPQGGVDNNEDIKSAALRELYEETGITSVKILAESKHKYSYLLPENLLGKIWKGKFKGQEQKWFLMKFLGDDKEININMKNPEFSEWQWVNIDDLKKLIVSFKKNLYIKVIQEFKKFI